MSRKQPTEEPRRRRRVATVRLSRKSARTRKAQYALGQVVRHRVYAFRGVVFDIDPVFNNTEEWWQSIPEEVRPHKDQPFYHLLAENSESSYIAYVSQQNLVQDDEGEPIDHPAIGTLFDDFDGERYKLKPQHKH